MLKYIDRRRHQCQKSSPVDFSTRQLATSKVKDLSHVSVVGKEARKVVVSMEEKSDGNPG